MPHMRGNCLASACYCKYSLYALGMLSLSSDILIQACKQNPPSYALQISDWQLKSQRSCYSSSFKVAFSLLMYGKELIQGQKKKKKNYKEVVLSNAFSKKCTWLWPLHSNYLSSRDRKLFIQHSDRFLLQQWKKFSYPWFSMLVHKNIGSTVSQWFG